MLYGVHGAQTNADEHVRYGLWSKGWLMCGICAAVPKTNGKGYTEEPSIPPRPNPYIVPTLYSSQVQSLYSSQVQSLYSSQVQSQTDVNNIGMK